MEEKKNNFFLDILNFQKEIGLIVKNADNPFFNSTYADLGFIIKEVKPVLAKHNLFILQPVSGKDDRLSIETVLYHASGEKISSAIEVTPIKQDPQYVGSLISYYRRYSLQSLLCLGMVDDDGNATREEVKKNDSIKELERIITEINNISNITELKKWYKNNQNTIEALPVSEKEQVMGCLAIRKNKIK